jgi:formylglycine-generating enzyme required for sulfatase activity
MKTFLILVICLGLFHNHGLAQGEITIVGRVIDLKTKLPLVNANIGIEDKPNGTATDDEGKFGLVLPGNMTSHVLFVSYIGYRTQTRKLSDLIASENLIFELEEAATVLDEITILGKSVDKFEVRKLESSVRLIKGNLYALNTEVTNKEYNKFLTFLIQTGQNQLYNKYKPDIRKIQGSLLAFFKGYHVQPTESAETKNNKIYDDYPVVNITYEAAVAYCQWLTDQYSTSKGKRKYKTVEFRLPTLREWQIAALGYPKFQSWELDENEVEVRIPENPDKNPNEEMGKKKSVIPVKGNDILYPWYGAYYFRSKAQNHLNCWLGNFKTPLGSSSCRTYFPDSDGFAITGKVGSYFPNDMGFYDVVGNAAEMIDERGKACGGSWDHSPDESTIRSIANYSGPDKTVGFRVFMEVKE